ncbi:MAG: muconolactone Delta-isomerase family protein [Solirubrobacterales bacterium]
MEFLVEIDVAMPTHLPEDELAELLANERRQGREFLEQGRIKHIWRVPGAIRNVGVWEAADATELHEAIASLPFFPWMTNKVTPLARHPISGG